MARLPAIDPARSGDVLQAVLRRGALLIFLGLSIGLAGSLALRRLLSSLLFANLTTVAGFGLLAFSSVSILQAMGITVAPGVILALVYSAIFSRQSGA